MMNLYFPYIIFFILSVIDGAVYEANCSKLLMGQYFCLPPVIDLKTQQPQNCQINNTAKVKCITSKDITCKKGTGINATAFEMEIDCQYTNGYSFETALLLSLFLGMFGADRFYLGYPAIGCGKLYLTKSSFFALFIVVHIFCLTYFDYFSVLCSWITVKNSTWLAKFCTLGFMFLGQMIDIILIALQIVGPSDGSHYVISYFGPKLTILKMNNDSYVMPQDDW